MKTPEIIQQSEVAVAICSNNLLIDAICLLESVPLEQYARWKKHSVADKMGRKCMDQVSVWMNKRAKWIERAKLVYVVGKQRL